MQANEAAEQAAVGAAEQWLALVDAGNSEESWQHAASLFKYGITETHFPSNQPPQPSSGALDHRES